MDANNVIEFFDSRAATWDLDIHNPDLINRILDLALPTGHPSVLDVGCGTGVLFPFFLSRGVTDLTAVDISPGMLGVAKRKFPDLSDRLVCADACVCDFARKFDCIIIYNAFPHFTDQQALIAHLASFLNPGGRLTIAHSAGREELNTFHRMHATPISKPLPPVEDLATLMARHLTVKTILSEEHIYLVTAEA